MRMAAGVLWSATSLLIALGAAIAVPAAFVSAPAWVSAAAYALLLAAALCLLTMMIVTLPRREAYDAHPSLDRVAPALAWPIRVGWWIGGVATGLAHLVIALTTPGGDVNASSRFAMSLLALLGAVVSLFTAAVVPVAALLALLGLWGAVIVLAIIRGVYGLVAPQRVAE